MTHVDLTLDIEKPAAGGRMIARVEGQVVLVSGAIPGERVRARVEHRGRDVIYASTVEVLEPSPDRRPGITDWMCGGNVFAHIDYQRQLALKADILRDALVRIGRLAEVPPIAVLASPELGYRMRARLHVRHGEVGFFREGTHEICDPGVTGQLLPESALVVARLAYAIRASRLDGLLGLELSENIPASERVVHFEVAGGVDPNRVARLGRVGSLTGLTCARSEPVGLARTLVLRGSPYVTDEILIAGADGTDHRAVFRRHVRAFFQGNRHLMPQLVARATALVGQGPVVDLYAGVGLFAVAVAAQGRGDIVAVEGHRMSADDLRVNAAPYGAAISTRRMAVEQYLRDTKVLPATTLIVDPPRSGMSREAMDAVVGQRSGRIVYVSCDVATFGRDLGRLVQAGYELTHVEALDMFPNTGHVEAIAALSLERPPGGDATREAGGRPAS